MVNVSAYAVPTDQPESDGTFAWDKTTMTLVEIGAGGQTGLGYTYADKGAGEVVHNMLWSAIEGVEATDIPAAWQGMRRAVRNLGASGIAACAISVVDAAL